MIFLKSAEAKLLLTRIFKACEIAGFPEDKRIKYEQEMNDEKRLRSEYNTAKRMGMEEGFKMKAIEIALKLISTGMSKEDAANITGVDINALQSREADI